MVYRGVVQVFVNFVKKQQEIVMPYDDSNLQPLSAVSDIRNFPASSSVACSDDDEALIDVSEDVGRRWFNPLQVSLSLSFCDIHDAVRITAVIFSSSGPFRTGKFLSKSINQSEIFRVVQVI